MPARLTRSAALRALVLILLLAFGLRLINLGGRTLWYDEAFAVLFSATGLPAMLYGTLTPVAGGAADIHPLLYYTTLEGWMRLVRPITGHGAPVQRAGGAADRGGRQPAGGGPVRAADRAGGGAAHGPGPVPDPVCPGNAHVCPAGAVPAAGDVGLSACLAGTRARLVDRLRAAGGAGDVHPAARRVLPGGAGPDAVPGPPPGQAPADGAGGRAGRAPVFALAGQPAGPAQQAPGLLLGAPPVTGAAAADAALLQRGRPGPAHGLESADLLHRAGAGGLFGAANWAARDGACARRNGTRSAGSAGWRSDRWG